VQRLLHRAPNGAMAAPNMRPRSIFRDRVRFHPPCSPRSFNIPLYERKATLVYANEDEKLKIVLGDSAPTI